MIVSKSPTQSYPSETLLLKEDEYLATAKT